MVVHCKSKCFTVLTCPISGTSTEVGGAMPASQLSGNTLSGNTRKSHGHQVQERKRTTPNAVVQCLHANGCRDSASSHAGLNHGPLVYKTNALPLSYKGYKSLGRDTISRRPMNLQSPRARLPPSLIHLHGLRAAGWLADRSLEHDEAALVRLSPLGMPHNIPAPLRDCRLRM